MTSLKKTLGAAALVIGISAVLSGTASAQWFGASYGGGHCGSGFSIGFSSGGHYAPAYPVYPTYPVYTAPCAPVYSPCYPVYRPVRHHRRHRGHGGW
jgi:hypothetical protein